MTEQGELISREELLRRAARESVRRRIAALPPEAVLQAGHDFSALDRRVYASLKALSRARARLPMPEHVSWRTARRIAVVAALLAALFGGTMMVSAERNVYVKRVVVEWTERDMSLRYEVGGRLLTALPEGYAPHYIPEGFAYQEESSFVDRASFQKCYENEDGFFILINVQIAENASGVVTDNEHILYELIDFGETDAYLGTFEDGDGYVMYWFADGIEHELYISAYLDRDEVFAIAENIY